jgi:hypothetical protein
MTGAFSMEFPLLDPPTTCAATFTGQLSPDGNTFTAPGMVLTTSPDCLSFSCACAETDPVELRGSRAPCGNGSVDAGEECDDATFGFPGSCCALNCTALPAGGSCFDDGNLCTDDICGAGGACTHPALPDGTACNDGRFCDGEETDCQGGVCTAGTAPCPLACDESTDQCVTACPFSPQSCRTAQKTLFSLKLRSDPTKDTLLWKWLKGTSTSQMEFGDPTDTADYALCMYGTLSSLLVAETVIPAGTAAWSALDSSGYKYNDPSGAVHSIERVLLKASGENKSKVLIKGNGADLPPLSLPLTSPLTVQLYNGRNGLCWGANYSLAQMRKNEANRLKAKTP